jgi:hypothetical protein
MIKNPIGKIRFTCVRRRGKGVPDWAKFRSLGKKGHEQKMKTRASWAKFRSLGKKGHEQKRKTRARLGEISVLWGKKVTSRRLKRVPDWAKFLFFGGKRSRAED